jgi:hypothetical protein
MLLDLQDRVEEGRRHDEYEVEEGRRHRRNEEGRQRESGLGGQEAADDDVPHLPRPTPLNRGEEMRLALESGLTRLFISGLFSPSQYKDLNWR